MDYLDLRFAELVLEVAPANDWFNVVQICTMLLQCISKVKDRKGEGEKERGREIKGGHTSHHDDVGDGTDPLLGRLFGLEIIDLDGGMWAVKSAGEWVMNSATQFLIAALG